MLRHLLQQDTSTRMSFWRGGSYYIGDDFVNNFFASGGRSQLKRPPICDDLILVVNLADAVDFDVFVMEL